MKKFLAIVLALAMTLALCTTAFAVEAKSADLTSHTYAAYQIFSGTQAADKAELGNVAWGSGINGDAFLSALKLSDAFGESNPFNTCATAADVAKAMQNWGDSSPEAKAFAKIAYDNKAGNGTACVNGETGLDAGYYLVVDTTVPASNATDFAFNLALLQLTQKGIFEIANKTDIPEVDKDIIEGETATKVNEASIGDEIEYKITGTLPTNIADYNTYFYKFTDTLSKGLTYNDDATVTVNGQDVTKYFFIGASDYDETNGTTITIAIADLLALENVTGVGSITKDTLVVITYTATLNENAVIAGAGNPNKVDLEYSNNPNESGEPSDNPPPENPPEEPTPQHPTGKTPEKEVKTFTTELTILKTDDKEQPLTGVAFKLTGDGVNVVVTTGECYTVSDEGTYWKLKDGTYTDTDPAGEDIDTSVYESTAVKYTKENTVTYDTKETGVFAEAFVDEMGHLTFTGLGAGEYRLEETVTPDGYNTISPIEFTVAFDKNDQKFSVTDNEDITVETDNTLFTTVVNQPGSVLPETGGIGTKIFYALGGVLLVGAAVMLITKKRMHAEA